MSTSLPALLQQLQSLYSSNSTSNASTLLVQAKIQLAQSGLLLPSQSSSKQDKETARDILSYGALLSVKNKDVKGFERYIDMLAPFWEKSAG